MRDFRPFSRYNYGDFIVNDFERKYTARTATTSKKGRTATTGIMVILMGIATLCDILTAMVYKATTRNGSSE